MIRRWVTSGRLPVKRESVGINQRTRLVRASSLARIHPIVDATVVMTNEVHKFDLLSIPRQQAQMQQEHQHIVAIVQRGQQKFEEHLQQTYLALEQGATALQRQLEEWNRRLASCPKTVRRMVIGSAHRNMKTVR